MLIRDIAELPRVTPMTDPVIVYGPFLGEFGHELMRWQGWVRWRMTMDRGTIIAITRLTNHALYGTTHVLAVPDEILEGTDCSGDCLYKADKDTTAKLRAWMEGVRQYFSEAGLRMLHYSATYARPDMQQSNYLDRQIFQRLGVHGPPPNLFGNRRYWMVYIRRRELASGKNIPIKAWTEFLAWMHDNHRPVLIGGIDAHEDIERTDRRKVLVDVAPDAPEKWLQLNIGYLCESEGALISESGTMYLAMLCGCSTLVFGSEPFRVRTERENVTRADLSYSDMGALNEVKASQMIAEFQRWEANARKPQPSRGSTHGLW